MRTPPVLVVHNNNGGLFYEFIKRREALKRIPNSKIRISGKCYSACTLYLAFPSNRLCITDNVRLGFHKPYGGTRQENARALQKMMNDYPEWIRLWLNRTGGITDDIRIMPYQIQERYIRRCTSND